MAETRKTLGLEKDIKPEDLQLLLEQIPELRDQSVDVESLKYLLKKKYGEQNPMNIDKTAPWWEKVLHYANTPQRAVLNPVYNKLQDESAKNLYTKESQNKLMLPWEKLSQEQKNEWYKNSFNQQTEAQNISRQQGLEEYKKNNDKELTRIATQSIVDEYNRNPNNKMPDPKSAEFQSMVAEAKNRVAEEMFGSPKENITGDYDMRVKLLGGKINFRDILERFGKPDIYKQPAVQRELVSAPITTALDLTADPLLAAGKIVKGGKAIAQAAGIVDDTRLLNQTRKISQSANLAETMSKLPENATLLNDVRVQNPIAVRKYAESIGKTVDQLDNNDIKQFILKDAADYAKNPLNVAKKNIGTAVSTTFNKLRETPNANRTDIASGFERLGSAIPNAADKLERSFVYEGIGKQGIRALQKIDPNMTEQNARDLFNKLREIRQERAAVSKGAVDQAKNLGKGTMFENFYRLPIEQQDELYNALESYYQKGGNPATFNVPNVEMSAQAETAASKLPRKSGEAFDKYRNVIDDFTKKSIENRTLANGEQIGGPMAEEYLVPNYLPHTHTDYAERLTREFQGTAQEIEALNGRKEIAGFLGDKNLIPEKLRPGMELYAGDFKQSKLTGKSSGDIGYTDARTIDQKAPTLKDLAYQWEMAKSEKVNLEDFLNNAFPQGTSKHTMKEYASMLEDPKKLEKMKQTPYSFKDLDNLVPQIAKQSGIDTSKIMNRNQYEYSRDIPLAAARAMQRMADRNFMLDSLVELNKLHGDESVMFVKRGDKTTKIPEGYVQYSDKTHVGAWSGKTKAGTPTLLSTTHDIYMRPELVDMLNNYKRNFAAEPGMLNSLTRGILNIFGATKASMTSYKPSGLGFVAGNAISSTIQTMAMAKSPVEYASTTKKAFSGILGKGTEKIKSPFGTIDSKQLYQEAIRRGVIQPSTPESYKAMQALAEEMKTSKLSDPAGSLRNVTRMKPGDMIGELAQGVKRQLSPTQSTWSKSIRSMSDAFETLNRTQAMIMFVERGMPLDMAADAVKKIYVDYQALAPGARLASRTAVPFISFTKAMTQNILNNIPMMAKINYAAEGTDRSKPTMGNNPDEVMNEAQRDPMGVWWNKNQQFSPSRFVMGSGVFGISPDPNEANFGVSPVVSAFKTAATGVKDSPMTPGGGINVENRDVQFLGQKFKKGDTVFGMKPGKLVEFAKLEPHLQFADQLMQYLPKDQKKNDLYTKARPWYEAVVPRLRNANNGYNLLVNENYNQGTEANKLLNSKEWAGGNEGLQRVIEESLNMKVANEQGPKKKIEVTDNINITPEQAKVASDKMIKSMFAYTDKSLRMLFLANAVKKRLEADNSIDPKVRQSRIEKVEEIEKNWGTKLLTVKKTYLEPYRILRHYAGLPILEGDIGK